jgi:molecular chaperone IbpA
MDFQKIVAQKEGHMNTFDLTPFYRHSIGFDHLENIFDSMIKLNDVSDNYPPYNIQSNGKDNYTIELAVAGFEEENLSINLDNGVLTISGNKDDNNPQYMHCGIANRSFRRTFRLAEYVEVIGAGMKNGILQIHLERKIPEELKPKNIEIKTGSVFKKFLETASKNFERNIA